MGGSPKWAFFTFQNQCSGSLKGLTHSVDEHSAENMIFGRIWGGRPGIETENASNRSSLVIEIYVTPF